LRREDGALQAWFKARLIGVSNTHTDSHNYGNDTACNSHSHNYGNDTACNSHNRSRHNGDRGDGADTAARVCRNDSAGNVCVGNVCAGNVCAGNVCAADTLHFAV